MSEPVDQSRLLGPDIPGPVDPPERNDMQLLDQLLAQAAETGGNVTVNYGDVAGSAVRVLFAPDLNAPRVTGGGESLQAALTALFRNLGLRVDTRAPSATEWKANADFAARQTQALEAMTLERDRLHVEVIRLQSVLAAANADCDARGREVDRLTTENRNLRGSVERLTERLNAMEGLDATWSEASDSATAMYRSQRDRLMAEVERLRVEAATWEEEAIHARSERDDLRERLSSSSARLDPLRSAVGVGTRVERKLYDYMVLEYRRDYAAPDIQDFAHTAQAWRLAYVLPEERLVIFEREITDLPNLIDSDLGALVRETLDLGGKLVIFTGDSVEDAVSIERTGPGEPMILAEGGDIETALVNYRTLEARNDG